MSTGFTYPVKFLPSLSLTLLTSMQCSSLNLNRHNTWMLLSKFCRQKFSWGDRWATILPSKTKWCTKCKRLCSSIKRANFKELWILFSKYNICNKPDQNHEIKESWIKPNSHNYDYSRIRFISTLRVDLIFQVSVVCFTECCLWFTYMYYGWIRLWW